jgi:hypothetical protein
MLPVVAPKIGKPKAITAPQASQPSSAPATGLPKTIPTSEQQDHATKVDFAAETPNDSIPVTMAVSSQDAPAAASSTQPTLTTTSTKLAKRRARARPITAITAAKTAKRGNMIAPPVKTALLAATSPAATPATQDSPSKGLTLEEVQARRAKTRQQQQQVATDQSDQGEIRAAARQAAEAMAHVSDAQVASTAVVNSGAENQVIGCSTVLQPILIIVCHALSAAAQPRRLSSSAGGSQPGLGNTRTHTRWG